jgi:uncharacterized protein (DUF1810 family)
MTYNKTLTKFLDAQNQMYLQALAEVRNGRKESHWMWFIFPQLKGLGSSDTARFYAINDLEEAEAFLNHPILGSHLLEITRVLLQHEDKAPSEIFPHPDDLKLHSSITLFSLVENSDPLFDEVLTNFFEGNPDQKTVALLRN